MKDLVNIILKIYHEGDLSYVLNKYIDVNYWDKKLGLYFPVSYIENMTDFNYSKCFSFAINISNTNMDLFSNNFNDYLKNNSYFYRFEIQISVIGPYVRYTYLKYFFDDKEKVLLESSDTPFDISHRIYTDALNHFIENEHLELLNADMLQVKVPEIKLELRGEDVSVYNCLFEDSSSFYPYLK